MSEIKTETGLTEASLSGQFTTPRVSPDTIIAKIDLFKSIIAGDKKEYPELRPADQTNKIIELMGVAPDGSIESKAAEKVLDILQKLYTENPNRSNYDALAVLSSSTSSVAQKIYGNCEAAHTKLFEEKQLAQFIVDNADEIKEFVTGRTNCPTILQRSFPFAEYIKGKPSVIEIGCGPGGVAGLFLSNPGIFLKKDNLIVPNSDIDLEKFKAKIGTESLIDKYIGLDLINQSKENSYFANRNNILFLLNLFGLKGPERPAAEAMIDAIQEVYKDGRMENFQLQQFDCGSLSECKEEFTKYGPNCIIYSSYTTYQLSEDALKSLLTFAAETGYPLILQGDPLSKREIKNRSGGDSDFGFGDWNILLTRCDVSKDPYGDFAIKQTKLCGVTGDLDLSYKKLDESPGMFTYHDHV